MTHLMSSWGYLGRLPSKSKKSFERAGWGDCLEVLWWWGGGAELSGLQLSVVWTYGWDQGQEHLIFLISLHRSGEEGKEGVMGLESCQQTSKMELVCSKYSMVHTSAKFVCLKFKFNWVSCVFIVAVETGNPSSRAEKRASLGPSRDCWATAQALNCLLPNFLLYETNEALSLSATISQMFYYLRSSAFLKDRHIPADSAVGNFCPQHRLCTLFPRLLKSAQSTENSHNHGMGAYCISAVF